MREELKSPFSFDDLFNAVIPNAIKKNEDLTEEEVSLKKLEHYEKVKEFVFKMLAKTNGAIEQFLDDKTKTLLLKVS